jgi:hypothetical protein
MKAQCECSYKKNVYNKWLRNYKMAGLKLKLMLAITMLISFSTASSEALAQNKQGNDIVNTYQKFDSLLTHTVKFDSLFGNLVFANCDTCKKCSECQRFIARNWNGNEYIDKDNHGYTGYRELFHDALLKACFPFHLNKSLIEHFYTQPDTLISYNDIIDEERYYTRGCFDSMGKFHGYEWISIRKKKVGGQITRALPDYECLIPCDLPTRRNKLNR